MTRRKKAWGPSNALWRWQRRKSSGTTARKTRSVRSMARRRYGRRRGGSRGGMGSLTPVLYGAAASYIAPKVGLSFNPLIVGAAGGFMARKNVMGALMGAGGAYLANMFLGGSSTGNGSW